MYLKRKRGRTSSKGKTCGKIIGTESEVVGIMQATFAEELPTPAIVVKGISDAANA